MRLLGLDKGPVGLDRVVELAHHYLGLDAVYVAEIQGDRLIVRAQAGDVAAFGVSVDGDMPLAGTIAHSLLSGAVPSVVADGATEPLLAALTVPLAGRVGAYVGIPLHYSDGSSYGAFFGLSQQPDPSLGSRDARFMAMLGELMSRDLDEQRRLERLGSGLQELIDDERIVIACQPIFDILTGRCLGVEALSRFGEPFSRPDVTFAAAEEVGLGLELERLAIRTAWPIMDELGAGQFLTINVGPIALLELARRANERTDLDLSNLVIEVTEHVGVESYPDLRHQLSPLRQQGLRLAVDDVGAGYASLHHIVELRPDFVKVDTSLVQGVAHDRVLRVTVGSLVNLALDLGATTVAEGVELSEDLTVLRDLGVDAAQGYLLGRPSTDPSDRAGWLEVTDEPPPSRDARVDEQDGAPD
jgi:EAL domain-containing protein (putative c-di-GMP-specific phosphodiesterase class I)